MLSDLQPREKVRAGFGLVVIVGFFVILGLFIFKPPETENATTVLTAMIGILAALVTGIGGYYYGSSQGSAEKQEQLNKLQGTGNGNAPK